MEYEKFIVVGNARSGTTLMVELLSSHKKIESFGEIFNLQELDENALACVLKDSVAYLEEKIFHSNYSDDIQAVGFKVLYGELGKENFCLEDPSDLRGVSAKIKKKRTRFYRKVKNSHGIANIKQNLERSATYLTQDKNLKVIHIKRKNKLSICLSHVRALRSGKWRLVKSKETVFLDPEECLQHFKTVERNEEKFDAMFAGHPIKEIAYEEMVKNKEKQLREVQEFLNVENQDGLVSDVRKQNTLGLENSIVNFQELKEEFRDTKWSAFFEADS
jgi:LPS sulfotransferase NodH